MAYEKQTWQCGDVVTAEKLNHIENGLEELSQSGGGYSCTESTLFLFEETVTTASEEEASSSVAAGLLNYAEPITADELMVTFNGVKYVCPKQGVEGMAAYGAMPNGDEDADFSQYPFLIVSTSLQGNARSILYTPQAGTYSIKGEAVDETIETTPCFDKAVASVNPPLFIKYARTEGSDTIFDKTHNEVQDAIKANRTVILCLGDTYTDTNVNRFYLLKSYSTRPLAYSFDGERLNVNDKGELFMRNQN